MGHGRRKTEVRSQKSEFKTPDSKFKTPEKSEPRFKTQNLELWNLELRTQN
jgi:hypothetical protein